VAEDLSQEDAPVEEVLPSVMLVEDGSGAGVPNSLLEIEAQLAPSPRLADVSFVGRTIKEMAWEEPPPRKVMVVAGRRPRLLVARWPGSSPRRWFRKRCLLPWH
jgi:hypothetical protein